ncbi:hypothetical protein RchiOBHm_Chr2g0144101 [Rosa chinensis]|uniref:Uncharacterized protein n=1 Tax=Rosa chinensis TaxID=74649 RepID=A0A2P6RYB7_ROSCH|nr:hypothetical protein RchiOBHm_Chr2g0144101 [Rosa chinensis]
MLVVDNLLHEATRNLESLIFFPQTLRSKKDIQGRLDKEVLCFAQLTSIGNYKNYTCCVLSLVFLNTLNPKYINS